MIEVRSEHPGNREHCSKLLAFGREIVAVCNDLNIVPVLTGSLAVFASTRSQALPVNDMDLACSEVAFPRIMHAPDANGIRSELKDWHVLQVRRDDLKVEFDSLEYWMTDLPEDHAMLVIDGLTLRVVGLSRLKELYRRGLEATAGKSDAVSRAKHAALAKKYETLCSVSGRDAAGWSEEATRLC